MTKQVRVIYEAMVRCYPREFREEYAPPMMETLDESLRSAMAYGHPHLLRLIWRLAMDWSQTMFAEWAKSQVLTAATGRCVGLERGC